MDSLASASAHCTDNVLNNAAGRVNPAASVKRAATSAKAASTKAATAKTAPVKTPVIATVPPIAPAPEEKEAWYAMRAYKSEERAASALAAPGGLPYFLPRQEVMRVYHGRKVRKMMPVIPSMIFVYATRLEIVAFKQRYNFLQFITQRRQTGFEYLTVPDKQMSDFIAVVTQQEQEVTYFRPEELKLARGSRVRIHGGPFDGVVGYYQRTLGVRTRRLVVEIPNTLLAAIEVSPDLVELVKE